MTCVECRKNRDDLMKELHYENMKKCEEAYQDGYNQALEDLCNKLCSNGTIADFMKDYIKEKAKELIK